MQPYDESNNALMPVGDYLATLGAHIEAFRLSRNLRQADVAEEAGVHVASLSRLERGKGASLDTLVRVLRALDCADRLTLLVPDVKPNPLDPKSASGKKRQRARVAPSEPNPAQPNETDAWSWGEDD